MGVAAPPSESKVLNSCFLLKNSGLLADEYAHLFELNSNSFFTLFEMNYS
jgi:hypothetical protein